MRNQKQERFLELAQSSHVGNASKLATIGPLVRKEMLHLVVVVTNQAMHKVVLLLQTSQVLHIRNHHWLSPLSKALQQLRRLGKGRQTLPVQGLHQEAWVVYRAAGSYVAVKTT